MADYKELPIPKNTSKIIFYFKPVFNGSPTNIKVYLHGAIDFPDDNGRSMGFGMMRLYIYDFSSSVYRDFDYVYTIIGNRQADDTAKLYFGANTIFYYRFEKSFSTDYINNNGEIKVCLGFDLPQESEISEATSSSNGFERNALLKIYKFFLICN